MKSATQHVLDLDDEHGLTELHERREDIRERGKELYSRITDVRDLAARKLATRCRRGNINQSIKVGETKLWLKGRGHYSGHGEDISLTAIVDNRHAFKQKTYKDTDEDEIDAVINAIAQITNYQRTYETGTGVKLRAGYCEDGYGETKFSATVRPTPGDIENKLNGNEYVQISSIDKYIEQRDDFERALDDLEESLDEIEERVEAAEEELEEIEDG